MIEFCRGHEALSPRKKFSPDGGASSNASGFERTVTKRSSKNAANGTAFAELVALPSVSSLSFLIRAMMRIDLTRGVKGLNHRTLGPAIAVREPGRDAFATIRNLPAIVGLKHLQVERGDARRSLTRRNS